MLTTQELRDLSHPTPLHTLLATAGDLLGIAAIFAVCVHWPHPWVVLPAMLLMGRQQLALAILMHDGAHRRLFKSARTNDLFGQWLLAGPLFFSMHSYKLLHLKHHKAPLADDDPDLSLTGGYPIGTGSFVRKLLRDAVGVSYFKFIRYFIYRAKRPPKTAGQANKTADHAKDKPSLLTLVGSALVCNGGLLAALWAVGAAWLYPLLWLLPMATVLQVLLRIRGVAEHAGYVAGEDQRLNSRTVLHPAQAWFFAPHRVNYHIEHHVYPSVPFYQLPQVHALMRDRGSLPLQNVFADYVAVVRSIVR